LCSINVCRRLSLLFACPKSNQKGHHAKNSKIYYAPRSRANLALEILSSHMRGQPIALLINGINKKPLSGLSANYIFLTTDL
jgi:hypothetical protein